MSRKFGNQVVIVTGASRGIGRGIAELFAEQGAKLVLVGRDNQALAIVANGIRFKGALAMTLQADVSVEADMKRMADETIAHFGTIDVLCHNAGIYPQARLEQMTLDEWQKIIDVNLTGTFLAVKACLPEMKRRNKGKIVITSSISGPQVALPGYSHYTASKGGIAGFVKTAAVELAKYKIFINSVEPGNIMTEGFDEMGAEHMNNMVGAPSPWGVSAPQETLLMR